MAAWQFNFWIIDSQKMKFEGQVISESEVDEYLTWNGKIFEKELEIISNKLFPTKSFSQNIYQFGSLDDSCVEIVLGKDSCEINCRISVYQFDIEVLETMLKLANAINGAVLVKGIVQNHSIYNKLYKATRNNLLNLIINSSACDLCKNKDEIIQYINSTN